MGYAIYKTVHLIAATRYFAEEIRKEKLPLYTIKSAIIVMITDGFQDPSHLDMGNRLRTIELEEVSNEAKKQGIRLFIINVDPSLNSAEYAPHRRQLQKITQNTGGDFYMVNNPLELQAIYKTIDHLEKGMIYQAGEASPQDQRPLLYSRFSLYPFLIAAGLFFLLAALIIETLILKRVP
jgi:Ca-activated chloride channel family protein